VQVFSYSDARAKLKEIMDRVVEDMTQVVITRQRGEAVVMLSLDDWNAISETLHLLSSPKNAERLHSSIAQLDSGKGTERKLTKRQLTDA
jgi:antitoxin YefM